MLTLQFRRLALLPVLASVLLSPLFVHAQDQSQDNAKRGRKYNPPPATSHVSVAVVKDINGKAVENAAVVFHLTGEEGKGNMEMKTNGDGKAIIDVIPVGSTLRLQVIANGFQTYGQDYQIEGDSKEIVVRLKRPSRQFSTYEHAETGGQNATPPAQQPPAPNPQ